MHMRLLSLSIAAALAAKIIFPTVIISLRAITVASAERVFLSRAA